MPLKMLTPIDGANIYIWEIKETTQELLDLNALPDRANIDKLRNVDHIKQTLAKNIIFNKLELLPHLYKDSNGKPFLNNGLHISISHSGKWVAISVAKFPIGIDVERPRKKLLKVALKYLNPRDTGALQVKDYKELLWYWTAKESIYKLINRPGLSLKNDILLHELDKTNKTASARIKNTEDIKLLYEKLPDGSLIALAYPSFVSGNNS